MLLLVLIGLYGTYAQLGFTRVVYKARYFSLAVMKAFRMFVVTRTIYAIVE